MKSNKKLKDLKHVSGGLAIDGLNVGGDHTNLTATDNSSAKTVEDIKQHDEVNISEKLFGFQLKM